MPEETDKKFPEKIGLQVPLGLNQRLNELAARRHQTRSELVRRCLLTEVESAGLPLADHDERAVA